MQMCACEASDAAVAGTERARARSQPRANQPTAHAQREPTQHICPRLHPPAPRPQAADVFDGAEEEVTISLKDLDASPLGAGSRVRFVVPFFTTKPGQQLFLQGSIPALGAWDPAKAVPLKWNEGHVHTAEVALPPGKLVEAKVRRAAWQRQWQRHGSGSGMGACMHACALLRA